MLAIMLFGLTSKGVTTGIPCKTTALHCTNKLGCCPDHFQDVLSHSYEVRSTALPGCVLHLVRPALANGVACSRYRRTYLSCSQTLYTPPQPNAAGSARTHWPIEQLPVAASWLQGTEKGPNQLPIADSRHPHNLDPKFQ